MGQKVNVITENQNNTNTGYLQTLSPGSGLTILLKNTPFPWDDNPIYKNNRYFCITKN